LVIDEPTAEALRSNDAVVGEMETYSGTILAVDKTTGSGKILLDKAEKPVRVKIVDPAVVKAPANVYTHALDAGNRVQVTAKPVLKGGEISTLYVFDARSVRRPRALGPTPKPASRRASRKKRQQ
jgi:hypothetical protein